MKKKNVCKKKTNTLKGGKNPKSYLLFRSNSCCKCYSEDKRPCYCTYYCYTEYNHSFYL